MLTADNEAPRPSPRLSAAQIERVLSEVALYFTVLANLRPIGPAGIATGTPEER